MKQREIYAEVDGRWYVVAGKLRKFLLHQGMENDLKRILPDGIPNEARVPIEGFGSRTVIEAMDGEEPKCRTELVISAPWEIHVNDIRAQGKPLGSTVHDEGLYSKLRDHLYSEEEEALNNSVDEITNQLMDGIQGLFEYRMGTEQEEELLVNHVGTRLSRLTVGDFDDVIYGIIHNEIKGMVRQGLITYKGAENQPEPEEQESETSEELEPNERYSSPSSIGLYRPC